jgi:hypothetical protein
MGRRERNAVPLQPCFPEEKWCGGGEGNYMLKEVRELVMLVTGLLVQRVI